MKARSDNAALRTGVIGHPIAHSLSPVIHNYWLDRLGSGERYEALDIHPDDLPRALPRLAEEGWRGVNLTLPHKEIAMGLCDEIDALGEAVGAVNTITFDGGAIIGTNTDVFGFLENMRLCAPAASVVSAPAVVIGAGGAARAAVHGLLQSGCPRVVLVNRSRENARALAEQSMAPRRVDVRDWDERARALMDAGLLVNTTPLGMAGQPKLEINLDMLPMDALVYDIVYKPLETPLLAAARRRGNPVLTGIGMLVQQAIPAFHRWHGVMPQADAELERRLMERLA